VQQQPHLREGQRGEFGPFNFPWELQEIARTFGRTNSAVTKWRAELESCGAASYCSGSWTLPVPEFFRETRFTHFTKVKLDFISVKCPSLLEEGEEYKEERNTYSRACARDNGPLGSKKLRAKAHAIKRRLARLHWDNCIVRFDEGVAFSFAAAALTAGFLEADILAAYDPALHKNHGRATDCWAIWHLGSTVSDAREFLTNTSRRFEPGRVDPDIVRQIRRVCSPHPARLDGSRKPEINHRVAYQSLPVHDVGSGHARN
jgi:hypothetical protein